MPTSVRNQFLEILETMPSIESLSAPEKTTRIRKIIADVESYRFNGYGIFEDNADIMENDLDDMDDLELSADRFFNPRGALINKILSTRKVYEQKDSWVSDEKTQQALSDDRVKAKQIELGIVPVLPFSDLGEKVKGNFGRCPLHTDVAMTDIENLIIHSKVRAYLEAVDNNGNTPLEMAEQEGFTLGVAILEQAMEDMRKCV